jgi:ribosome-associated toxin RatA of RatAB toxin-antitoxin module
MAELETSHVFNGNINKVFEGIGQFARYPEFIPGVTGIKILPPPPGSSAKCLVRYELNIVKTFFYTIEMFEESPQKIWWTMTESNLMKKNDGSWTLTAQGKDKTAAVYKLDVSFKGLVPSMITDQIAKANLPGMFDGFQKLIDAVR